MAMVLLATAVAFGSVISTAAADRKPSKRETAAIKRVALEACRSAAPDECEFGRARVSTRNARYAWADVVGEGFSGVLVKRPTRRSRRFKVVGSQGGGISTCSYWRARAPDGVLRDLRITGLVDDTGAARNCGRRR